MVIYLLFARDHLVHVLKFTCVFNVCVLCCVMQEKYSIRLSLKQLSDKCYCTQLLDKLTEQHLVSVPSLSQVLACSPVCMHMHAH